MLIEAISKIVDNVQENTRKAPIRFKSGAYTSWLEATPTTFINQGNILLLFSNLNSGSGILPRLISISIRGSNPPKADQER
jgi:hypothetical protein